MADVKLVKSIYTGGDVTSLGEVAAADTPAIPGTTIKFGASTVTVTATTSLDEAVAMSSKAPKLETIKSAGALAVLRRMQVLIRPGSAGGTITVATSSIYNGDEAAQSANIAKGATVSPFSLDATGTIMSILDAGITGTLLAVLGVTVYGDNSGITSIGQTVYISGTSIAVSIRISTADANADMTTLGSGKYWQLEILYLTSA